MNGYDYAPTREDTDVIGARIGAAIVDTIVVVVATVVLAVLGASVAVGTDSESIAALVVVLAFVFVVVYYLLLEGLWNGQTVGKKALDIRVVKEDGRPIDLGDSVVRNLLRIVDGILYYAVGFAFMASSDRRMRLGDRLAGTVVVRATPGRGRQQGRSRRDRRGSGRNEPGNRERDRRGGDAGRGDRSRRDSGWNEDEGRDGWGGDRNDRDDSRRY